MILGNNTCSLCALRALTRFVRGFAPVILRETHGFDEVLHIFAKPRQNCEFHEGFTGTKPRTNLVRVRSVVSAFSVLPPLIFKCFC